MLNFTNIMASPLLMSLAMDLAALCDMWRWKWYQWMPFGCCQCGYSLSLSLRGSPPFHPMEVLLVLAMPVKKYLKWWAIQLAIQCTVDTMNYLEYFKSIFLNSMYKQGHWEGRETGAVCPEPHSVRGPILIHVTSIMQKCYHNR